MATPRTWLAIPAIALACAALAALSGAQVTATLAVSALAAAIAAAVRAFAGGSLAATLAAAAGALLAVVALVTPGLPEGVLARAALAGAAAMFAIAELARPMPPSASPWPAIGAAAFAGVLDPSFVVLAAVAGARLALGPWSRPRWAIALPLVGTAAIALATLAACAHGGVFAGLWHAWAHPGLVAREGGVAARAGDALGPLAIVGGLAGLASCAFAGRSGAVAVLGIALGAVAVTARTGALAPSLIEVAALACGVAIARLAALVRHPVGQACTGAAAAFVVVAAPAWTLVLG